MKHSHLFLFVLLLAPLAATHAASSSAASGAADNEGIAIWGHSMPADVTPARLEAALRAVGAAHPGRPIINECIGGSGIYTSLMRQGAIVWTVEVAGGVIPAEGRVGLTNHHSPALEAQLGAPAAAEIMAGIRWLDFRSPRQVWVEIGGVIGQLGREREERDEPLYFQRRDAGQAVRVKNPVAVRMLAVGTAKSHDLATLNRYLNILWGPGMGQPSWPEIYRPLRPGEADASAEREAGRRLMVTLVEGVLDRMSARDKRLIVLEGMPFTAPSSRDAKGQGERYAVELARGIYQKHFPKYYFDYVAASLTGLGPVPPAREWFAKAHPAAFNDPATGWTAELDVIPVGPYKGERHTGKEPAAVAEIRLIGNGNRGVTSAARVGTETPGVTRWAKTGLFVGVKAEDGVAVRLNVREGGRGYAVGDPIVIPAGLIGNAAPITGEVAAIREETIGTVRHPDGTVDGAHSYSQWDVDNGYWPRCFRRDFIHFNEPGAEYLSHLLAARIKQLGW